MPARLVLLSILFVSLIAAEVVGQSRPVTKNKPALWLVDDRSGKSLQKLSDGARVLLAAYQGKSLNVAAQAPSSVRTIRFRSSEGYARSTTRRPFLLFSRNRPLNRGALHQGGTLQLSVQACVGTCSRSSSGTAESSLTVTFIAAPSAILPTNSPPRPTPLAPLAVPGRETWEQKMLADGRKHCSVLLGGTRQGEILLGNVYYDAERVFQQIRDYTGDSSWQACVDAAERQYRDLYVTPNSGSIPAYWNFTSGLAHDFIESRDPASRDAVELLANNAAFAPDQTPVESLRGWEYSRETALTILTYLEAEKVGLPRRARLLPLANTALNHIQQWFVTREARYVKSFMVGITSIALIDYYNATGDSRVIPALTTALDGLWALNWVEGSRSFKYTDIQNPGDEPTTPAPDLNQIIAPAFAWMYFQTGEVRFRERGDKIFQGGADLGYSAGAKQFNQLYRWSFDYVRWRSLRPLR